MKRVIALGFFDGVHLGHQALLRRTAQVAAALGAVAAAHTFDPSPAAVLTRRDIPLLTTPEERRQLMETLCGIQETLVAPFDEAMRTMAWKDFVTRCLVGELNACHLVVGHDYRFGYGGQGTPGKLQALCAQLSLGCDVIPEVCVDGQAVSSTRIRALVEQGEVEQARRLLGHPYLIQGVVAHGKGLGHTLGFPTANLTFDPRQLLPANGVYAGRVTLDNGAECAAAVNIGVRPTVDQNGAVSVECFLLDQSGDLYGRPLALELYSRLRTERRFDTLEALQAQVHADAQAVRAYFSAQA